MCQIKDGIIEYESAELYLYDYVDNYFDNNLIAKNKKEEKFRRSLYQGFIANSKFLAAILDESITSDKPDVCTFVCYIDFNNDLPISIEFFPSSSSESFKT